MYCPYCGKKNDDSAAYCSGCGQLIKENPGFSEPNQPMDSDPSGSSGNGGGNRNRIYIIVIIIVVAAAVVAILFLTDVLHWPGNREDSYEATEEIVEPENATGEDVETEINGVTSVQEQEEEEAEEEEEEEEITEISEGDMPEEVYEQIEPDIYEDPVIETQVAAETVYDKNGVLSTLYEVSDESSAAAPSYVYGLTYRTGSEDPARITDLTDESDAEVLEKMQDALRLDQSKGYLDGTEAQIDSLTLNDVEYEDEGRELSFIVEGGEIVLLVNAGELLPSGSDVLKVPIDVYISTMSYDEYTADYIFPNSSDVELDDADLEGLSKEESRLARDEIFARHGRIYEDENLNAYFSQKDWYTGTADEDDFDMSLITKLEWKNLDKLNDYDMEMGYQNIGEF